MQPTPIPVEDSSSNDDFGAAPVTLTAKAVEAVRAAMAEDEDLAGHGLRVAVVGGGCSGFSYALDFSDEADPEDLVMELNGLQVYIDPNTAAMLNGTEIDYVSTLTRSGFVFNNPNAQRTCGCGSSFS
jgi:iron-sulfur cluster assembly accessory protein